MKFDKNKDEQKNLDILKKEIKKSKIDFSKILAESLFDNTSPDDFRNIIKEKITRHIENKIIK